MTNQFHLQMSSNNNDGSSVATYVPVLNRSNYREWESQMTAFLRLQGLWRIVNWMATHPDEATHVDAANKWDMSDNMAQGQITLRLDPTICNQVGATSAATWTNLANAFGTTEVSKVFGDFCALDEFRMSGSQHPGAEIERFNMHLQRLKLNQVDIPDSIVGLMVLSAMLAKWDHVSAIYLQGKTAIGQVSLSEVCQAVVAEFDWTGSGNQQHAHCITAVKRKVSTLSIRELKILTIPLQHKVNRVLRLQVFTREYQQSLQGLFNFV